MRLERFLILVLGLAVGTPALSGCSTDNRGLGAPDGGGTGGSSPGTAGTGTGTGGATSGTGGSATGSGGAPGSSGGATGSSGGATASSGGATASGGNASGGRIGSGGVGSGGSGTGGRVGSGGAGAGGRAAGGRGGRGDGSGGAASGGRGAGGAGGSKPECTTAGDCKLVSDCCTCHAAPTGEAPPTCSLVCIQSKCAAQQLPADAVACVAGRCVAGFNCDASNVTCRIAVPVCAAGEVPAVTADGTCYGGCVAASQCKTVTSCAACTGANLACATFQNRGGTQYHCVTVPPACGGVATCACLGPTTCVAPYTSCNDVSGIKGVACGCPTC